MLGSRSKCCLVCPDLPCVHLNSTVLIWLQAPKNRTYKICILLIFQVLFSKGVCKRRVISSSPTLKIKGRSSTVSSIFVRWEIYHQEALIRLDQPFIQRSLLPLLSLFVLIKLLDPKITLKTVHLMMKNQDAHLIKRKRLTPTLHAYLLLCILKEK